MHRFASMLMLAALGGTAFAQARFEEVKADLRSAGVSEQLLAALESARRKEVIDAFVAGRTNGLAELITQMKKSTRLDVFEVPPAAERAQAGKSGKTNSPPKPFASATDATAIAQACDRIWEHILAGEARRLSFGDDGSLHLTVTYASHEEIVCRYRFEAEFTVFELTIWPRLVEVGGSDGPFGIYHITPESAKALKEAAQQGG